MNTLPAQKENVNANVVGAAAAGKRLSAGPNEKFSTPKWGFVIHDDSKSTGKKALQENSPKKSRRALSDISNKQRNRQGNNNAGGSVSIKKKGLGSGLGHSKKHSAKKRPPLTPLSAKANAPLTPKVHAKLTPDSAIKTPCVEEVPDIELAYGGLSPPKEKAAFAKGLSDDEIQNLLSVKTPTLFDDFEPTLGIDGWDDSREKAMLESGEPPSLWWASPDLQVKKETDDLAFFKEEEKEPDQVEDDLSELPPPDNLPDGAADLDDDGLLEELLSVDVEAVCSE
ncbi:hypothetical protein PHYPSEUDO_007999 [Phytophthora pseudosyringae]|uniref:Uncharacterized protein n=1 Tax=Phytophthora pseudosyringae TaxID=221518 RepID=A0A8T1VFT9_9STRA|nr:hypothetical protein PHYPSEUDO_007999 [Phytophthora pseudosyringae]